MTAAKTEFDVFLESFQLVFKPMLLILQLFNGAICLTQFVFKPIYPQCQPCGLAFACLLAWHFRRRRIDLRHL